MRRALAIAILCLASLAAQDRTDPGAVRASGLAAASQALAAGKLDEAERHLTQVAALGRDIRVEILRGELLVAKKDAAGAAGLLEEAIRTLKPAGELARAANRTHARALVELGRFGDAAPAILRSFGLDDAGASSLALAARGLAELGDRALARSVLGLAFHLDPKRTDLLATRAELALEDVDSTAALRDAEALVTPAARRPGGPPPAGARVARRGPVRRGAGCAARAGPRGRARSSAAARARRSRPRRRIDRRGGSGAPAPRAARAIRCGDARARLARSRRAAEGARSSRRASTPERSRCFGSALMRTSRCSTELAPPWSSRGFQSRRRRTSSLRRGPSASPATWPPPRGSWNLSSRPSPLSTPRAWT